MLSSSTAIFGPICKNPILATFLYENFLLILIVSVSKSNEIRKKEIFISPTFSYNLRGFQVDPGWQLRQPKKFSPTSSTAVDKMSIHSDHKNRQKRRRIIRYDPLEPFAR